MHYLGSNVNSCTFNIRIVLSGKVHLAKEYTKTPEMEMIYCGLRLMTGQLLKNDALHFKKH